MLDDNMKGTFFKNSSVECIYLQLGNGCNLRCKYCYHNDDVQEYKEDNYINDDIFIFIEDCCARQTNTIKLRFFGGEPTLYFDKIKYIVERTSHIKNLKYTMITNGKLITKDMAEFFNKYHFRVTISWDGHEISRKYRGYDAIGENKQNIFLINEIIILSTIVKPNDWHTLLNDVRVANDEYFKIHGVSFNFNYTFIEDSGSQSEYIYHGDLAEVTREGEWIADQVREIYLKKPEERTPFDIVLISLFCSEILGTLHTEFRNFSIQRGSDNPSTFSLDLHGNLYAMHRYPESSKHSEKICTIYDHYYTYLKKILNMDNRLAAYKDGCNTCRCYGFCRGANYFNQRAHGQAVVTDQSDCCAIWMAFVTPLMNLVEELCGAPMPDLVENIMRGEYKN